MAETFIDIPKLVPERLRNDPLLKDVVDALEHIFYVREAGVAEQLEAIREKYVTYLVLAREEAYDTFQLKPYPEYTEVAPTVHMDDPLIKRERVSQSFGVGTHHFIAPALSLEPISALIADQPIDKIEQVSDVQPHMKEGYFEENCLYEVTCSLPATIEYTGLAHGNPAPIESIKDPTLGLIFDTRDLRGSDLYAMEPGFPYLVRSEADDFEWTLKGKRYDERDLQLSKERNAQIISEFGYQYLLDALDLSPMDVALIRSFITTIHWLKGSRRGVDLLIDLLELEDYVQVYEWWEDNPHHDPSEGEAELAYRVEVDLRKDNIKLRNDALQALRLFLRQYVYPIMSDFGLLINFIDEPLKTAVNTLTFQTLQGAISSPLAIGSGVRVFQNMNGQVASPVMVAINGLTDRLYEANMEDVRTEYTFTMADEQLRTAFNVSPQQEIRGQSAAQVLFGAMGVAQARFRVSADSPLVLSANGILDQDLTAEFKPLVVEATFNFEVKVASGTKGYVVRELFSPGSVSPMMLLVNGMHDQDISGTMKTPVDVLAGELVGEPLNTGVNVLSHSRIHGATSTPLVFGTGGVHHSRFRGSAVSPLTLIATGITDQEFRADMVPQITAELEMGLEVKVASGTKGFTAQTLVAELASPMLLVVSGAHDQDISGSLSGDVADAP